MTLNETAEVPTDLEKKIIRQVEYYFGDANMAKDKFLLEQIKKDDGWVSFEVLCTFNRLKQLSEDHAAIATALRKSTAGLLQVSEDGSSVRRAPDRPLPELNKEKRDEMASRLIYAKRFPLEATLEKLQDYFAQFGEVEQIQMRKNIKRTFKGSVFVLFARKEDAQKFLESEAVPFEETALEMRLTKDAYYKLKNEEKKKYSEEREKNRQQEMKLREEEEEQKLAERITTGAVVHLTWTAAAASLDVASLKEFFATYGKVAWVDAPKDASEAYVRFETGIAQTAWDAAVKAGENNAVVIKGVTVNGDVLSGDAETNHWKQIFQDKKDHRDKGSGGRRGGGRGGFRGRGRGRGGRGGDGRFSRRGEKRAAKDEAAEDNGSSNAVQEAGGDKAEPGAKRVKADETPSVATPAAAGEASRAADVSAEKCSLFAQMTAT